MAYQNHPHEYGEYNLVGDVYEIDEESPPCVWGVLHALAHTCAVVRITPMCMGSTGRVTVNTNYIKNHPHEYGEYESIQNQKDGTIESPPCVWGVPCARPEKPSDDGITPMCMGSTVKIT